MNHDQFNDEKDLFFIAIRLFSVSMLVATGFGVLVTLCLR